MRVGRTSVIGAVLAFAAACGGGGEPTGNGGGGGGGNTCTSTSTSVTVNNNSFTPRCTTVPAGSTITWTWGNNATNGHNVTFPTPPSSATETTGTFQRTFAAAGTFSYLCTVHGAAMSGSIVVQ